MGMWLKLPPRYPPKDLDSFILPVLGGTTPLTVMQGSKSSAFIFGYKGSFGYKSFF